MRRLDAVWNEMVSKARLTIPASRLTAETIEALDSALKSHPGHCKIEFELLAPEGTILFAPNHDLLVNPCPSFVHSVENLFGEKSVSLYT
jgi:hypothetical protein